MEIIGVTYSVVQYLRDHIITGEIGPGERLNELELSSRLGISRPPLREAFRVLENEYLVESIPRKGSYVTKVSIGDCREMYKAREIIECSAVNCLKERNIRDLPEVASAMASALPRLSMPSQSDQEKIIEYPNPFPNYHIKLVEATGNSWLIRLYHSICPTLARYQFMCYEPSILKKVQKDHEGILESIRRGKYDQARELLSTHINAYVEFLEGRLRNHLKLDT